MTTIECRPIVDQSKWLGWRREDVTGSVVAACPEIAVHPYVTPLRLYMEKAGVEFIERPESLAMRRGRWCEPAVQAAVAEKMPSWKIKPAKVYLRDPDLRLGATPDFFVHGDPRGLGVLQAKTTSPVGFENDWAGGTEVPMWITLQTVTEMMLAGAAWGAVAVLIIDPFKMDVALIDVPHHVAAWQKIKTAVRSLWNDVAAGREPQPDFARDAETIRMLVGKEQKGHTFDATGRNDLPEMLAQRAALKFYIKSADERCAEIENEIKFLMGDAEAVENLPGWRITFKSGDRAGYTVPPKKDVRTLRIYDRRPPEQQPGAEGLGEGIPL